VKRRASRNQRQDPEFIDEGDFCQLFIFSLQRTKYGRDV